MTLSEAKDTIYLLEIQIKANTSKIDWLEKTIKHLHIKIQDKDIKIERLEATVNNLKADLFLEA